MESVGPGGSTDYYSRNGPRMRAETPRSDSSSPTGAWRRPLEGADALRRGASQLKAGRQTSSRRCPVESQDKRLGLVGDAPAEVLGEALPGFGAAARVAPLALSAAAE